MKRKQYIITILITALLSVGIMLTIFYIHTHEHNSSTHEPATEEEAHDHAGEIPESEELGDEPDHEEEGLVHLTEDQLQSVGIELGVVEQKQLEEAIRANGILRVPNAGKAKAVSLYPGVVRTLSVQMGDHVTKGQVIATIQNPEFVKIQEQFLTTRVRDSLAHQEMERQKTLREGDAGAGRNYENARAELTTVHAELASLRRQIQLMGIDPKSVSVANLRDAIQVLAPLTGTVSQVFATVGGYVDVSTPLATLVDNGAIHLDLQVYERDLPYIRIGQIVHFRPTNRPKREYDAKVFSIGSSFEGDAKTIAVHCEVLGGKRGLLDGQTIRGILSLSSSTSLSVPNTALVNHEGNHYIFLLKGSEVKEMHGHRERVYTFEREQVAPGVSAMGYTAISPMHDHLETDSIAVTGAFFINAKMSNAGEAHQH